jgi:SAM-dependent methyltransferase
MSSSPESYYNEEYYRWQERIGQFSGRVNVLHYQPHVQTTDRVIDFGCGGGFLLAALVCSEKKAVEINDTARQRAIGHGFEAVKTIAELPDNWADVLISNSVLEHVTHPFEAVQALLPKLKPGGRLVFMIPHEVAYAYFPGDVNQHLYTWSPMCAGNLFTQAGYEVESAHSVYYAWPPKYELLERWLGARSFYRLSHLWGRWVYPWFNPLYMRLRYGYPVHLRYVKVLARRPAVSG